MKASTLAGAGLKIFINNRILGVCTAFEWEADGGRRPIFGLDQVIAFELAPGASTITGRIEYLRLRLDGGLEGRGIAAPDKQILSEKYISIILVDRLTDAVVLKIDNAAVNNQRGNVTSRSLFKGSFTFTGIGFSTDNNI